MKYTTLKKFSVLFLAISFLNISVAKASNIAVVDIENVLKNCNAMKDAQQKLSKKQATFQKEIDKKQESLEKESKQISAKKSVLSEEAFSKEQDKFSKKVDDLKEVVNSRQESLKKSSIEAISKINDNIKSIIDTIRDEKKLDVILSASSIISYQANLNISDEVLEKLNKKISKIEIK